MATLAERVGVSRKTLGRVFKGDDRVAAGVYFETAYVLGVPLFETEPGRLTMEAHKAAKVEALMVKRVRQPKVEIDDDF